MNLPYVDRHDRVVLAAPATVFDAVLRVVEKSFNGGAESAARILGSVPSAASGPRPLQAGATMPGFAVTEADAPRRLALEGRHRFSRYALTFELEALPGGGTRVGALTHAEFPGWRGRVYRTLVIGTRGHVLVVRRMLSAVARRAESA